MWVIVMILTFAYVFVLSRAITSPVVNKLIDINQKRSENLANIMDKMFIKVKVNRIVFLYTIGPPLIALIGYFVAPVEFRVLGMITGFFIGLMGPGVYVKFLQAQRRQKFEDQLVDALMIMSSSLKGGFSLVQALEVVTEEMPDPMSQEFKILIGENKMGVALEDSFAHLYERMPLMPVHQMITAILLARETGGNLPVIFSRIVTTIRENKKIKQNLDNLTLQGRIQGFVMTLLPVAFAFIVTQTNKGFFDEMFKSQIGKILLVYCFFSEVIGAFMIWKISTFKDY